MQTMQYVLCTSVEDTPQKNPIIARIDRKAGHGSGRPTRKLVCCFAHVIFKHFMAFCLKSFSIWGLQKKRALNPALEKKRKRMLAFTLCHNEFSCIYYRTKCSYNAKSLPNCIAVYFLLVCSQLLAKLHLKSL
jgi:hypothetical protein